MSKKLNKLLEHLISNDQDAATALIHDYFVEAARGIHESFIAEEDLDDELSDDEVMDDDSIDDAEGEVEDELVDDGDMGDEDMDSDMDADMDADMDGEEGEVELEDRVEDLESQLEKLQAEFDELSAVEDEEHEEMGLDGDFGDEDEAVEGDDEEVEDEEAAEDDGEEVEDEAAEGEEEGDDDLEESISWDDDDFLSLGESAYEDLQKVNVTMSQGEIGTGSKVAGEQASPVVSRAPGERAGGKAVEVKSTNHTGYDREKAPSSKEGTGAASPRNVRSTATAGNEKVTKGGNSTLNSTKGFGEEGKTSPIGSREMRGKGKI